MMTSRYVIALAAACASLAFLLHSFLSLGAFGRLISPEPNSCLPVPFLYRWLFADPYYFTYVWRTVDFDFTFKGLLDIEHPWYYLWSIAVPYPDFVAIDHSFYPYWSYFNWRMCRSYSYAEIARGWALFLLPIISIIVIELACYVDGVRLELYNRLLQFVSSALKPDFRSEFRRATSFKYRNNVHQLHSHPAAAANRAVANEMIDNFCNLVGLSRFDHSTASSGKWVGSRLWHFAKDVRSALSFKRCATNCVETMIDVDYYPDMSEYLDGNNMFCLYSFVPETVTGEDHNTKFWFETNGNVVCQVDGGAVYEHKLWDYSADDLTIDHWWGSAVYAVDAFQCNSHRRLILLSPVRNIYTPLGWFLPGKRLQRWDVVKNNVACIRNSKGFSMSRAGQRVSVDLPERVVVTALTRLSSSKTPHMSDIERIFRTEDIENYVSASAIFYDVWQDLDIPVGSVATARGDEHSYQSIGPLCFEDGKVVVRSLSDNFFMSGYAPTRSYNNDEACIYGRITSVRNTASCPVECLNFTNELISFICEEVGINHGLHPFGYEDLRERLRNASNLAKRMDSSEILIPPADRVVISSFQKGEAYPKVAPPRNISTLPVGHNFRFAQFTYVAGEVFKMLDFYGPGKHPQDLAARVVDISSASIFINNTDISKMDGSNSEYLARFYLLLMLALFHEDYADEIKKMFLAENTAKAFTGEGVMYDTQYTIASGSSTTSQRGTWANVLMSYSSLRMSGYEPRAAFLLLGIYFGDDGMTPNVPANTMQKCCARHGVLVKSEIVRPGDSLVFLGRMFIDPFFRKDTIADVPRQLRKLHLTDSPLSVPRGVILRRRALSMLITDLNTPILSHWARAVIRLTNDDPEVRPHIIELAAREDSYWLRFESPFEVPTMEESLSSVVEMLNLPAGDIMDICIKIDAAVSLDEVFVPISRDLKVEVPAVIAGQVVDATDPPNHVGKINSALSQSTGACRDFQKGLCKREKCKFDHIKLVESVCRDWQKGLCKRIKCKFVHK